MTDNTEVSLGWAVRRSDKVTVVRFAGSVDLSTRAEFADAVRSGMESSDPVVILDLADIDFLGSVGLAVLLQAHQEAEATGRTVRIVDGTPIVRRILSISGLAHVLAVYSNLDEAQSHTERKSADGGFSRP